MEIIEIQSGKYNYLLRTHKGQFYISDLVCHIIRLMQEKKNNEEIAQAVNATGTIDIALEAEDIVQLKGSQLATLGILDENGELLNEAPAPAAAGYAGTSGRGKYLLFKIDVLSARSIGFFARHLTWLFNASLYWWVFWAAIVVNIALGYLSYAHIAAESGIQSIVTGNTVNWSYLLVYYPAAIIVLLLHEMGHATPAYHYKAPPRSIGFGLYLVFPVFYADVSNTWQLDAPKRMIVNAGGIYIQLIVNALLLLLLPFLPSGTLITAVVLALINLNFITFFINVNPFFKFDGYWLYADYFQLPNLHKKANAWLWSHLFPGREDTQRELAGYNTWPLAIYSLLYAIFMAGILFILARGLVLSTQTLQTVWPIIATGSAPILVVSKFIGIIVTTSIISIVLYFRFRVLTIKLLSALRKT